MEQVVPTPKPLDLNALAEKKEAVVEQKIGTGGDERQKTGAGGDERTEGLMTEAQRQIMVSQNARRKLQCVHKQSSCPCL